MLPDSATPFQQTPLTLVAWAWFCLQFSASSAPIIIHLFQKVFCGFKGLLCLIVKKSGKSIMVLKVQTTEEVFIRCKNKSYL